MQRFSQKPRICMSERCSATSRSVYRSGRYPVCSSIVTVASRCPPFKATNQLKRVYWCAELLLNLTTTLTSNKFLQPKYQTPDLSTRIRESCSSPSLVRGLRTTYCLTSSSLDRLKSLRILLALLGPRRRGTVLSVSPGMSFSPAHTFNV